MILVVVMLRLVFSVFLYLVRFLLSYKVKNSNKLSPFECGFKSIRSLQTTFRLQFFIILLIFILFDLEVVLLMGFLMIVPGGFIIFCIIILFVVGRVYLEWYLGKLQ